MDVLPKITVFYSKKFFYSSSIKLVEMSQSWMSNIKLLVLIHVHILTVETNVRRYISNHTKLIFVSKLLSTGRTSILHVFLLLFNIILHTYVKNLSFEFPIPIMLYRTWS